MPRIIPEAWALTPYARRHVRKPALEAMSPTDLVCVLIPRLNLRREASRDVSVFVFKVVPTLG
jgi:hypothetical protein